MDIKRSKRVDSRGIVKGKLHPRSRHQGRYNFNELIEVVPELSDVVVESRVGDLSIDFANSRSVKLLNMALLVKYYGIKRLNVPDKFLSPPIPGRADYIHYVADLLAAEVTETLQDTELTENTKLATATGANITCLDIGVGANCIYPIIGNSEYGWSFIGTEVNLESLKVAQSIIDDNPNLTEAVKLRCQRSPNLIFRGVVRSSDKIDVTICNPPFHASPEEVIKSSTRKVSNLQGRRVKEAKLNFSGVNSELWCTGGEARFIKDMIYESRAFGEQCRWFTSLVSKEKTLPGVYATLKRVGATRVKTVEMGQGNKQSRFIAWSFC